MLNIVEKNLEELTTLQHSPTIFHEALAKVKEGECRFHVTDSTGQVADYDLVYTDNMYLLPERILALVRKMTNGSRVYEPFLDYDEQDTEHICLEFLQSFTKLELTLVDEYSIVTAALALKHTDLHVYYSDERLEWFIAPSDRLHKVNGFSSDQEKTTLRLIDNAVEMGYTKRDWSCIASVAAFKNLFFWQPILSGKKDSARYLEVVLTDIIGIGGILSFMSMLTRAMEKHGLQVYLRPGCTRYPDSLLCKYFRITPKPDDADDSNTIVLSDLPLFTTTWYSNQFPAIFDEGMLSKDFARELEEYAEAVLGEKKTLGLLVRGTDYLLNNLGPDRIHANAEQMITVIEDWLEKDGYEKIFLATEDKDYYDKLRKAFPGKVIAISQERHTAAELKKKGSTLISEFEQKMNQGQAYTDTLEDTTVNYFYALYILSRCDAFLCSGQCNGWDTVLSLNKGKFTRKRKLTVAIDGDPIAENWKEIRPVTAGMFARGSYPTNRAFFLTYRFDLHDQVKPEAIKSAWEKTLKAWPYMSYAVGTRRSRLLLLENPLPFVIQETGEVIEPFGRSGNFHTVTFCYLEKTLWIYADHVPIDGTGFMQVLETFFYHYFSALDQKVYPVPDGVYTGEDGAVPGQDIDAYLLAEASDPQSMAKMMTDEKSFTLPEDNTDELFLKREDCRAYCISVPSRELMTYAKSVKGSPMSLLSVFLAKAIARIHPENDLPIKLFSPVSIRKALGNSTSLLHQVVHESYAFRQDELAASEDEKLHAGFREALGMFSSEQNIRRMCGIYRGICEGYTKAFSAGALDSICMQQRAKAKGLIMTSYLGRLRTGDYGNRIRMTAFHAMQERGIMIQTTEIGSSFYIDWYQGFHGESYAKAMRDLLREKGMPGAELKRIE